jgi:hypothetical protein
MTEEGDMQTPSGGLISARCRQAGRRSIAVVAVLAATALMCACGSSSSSPGPTTETSTPSAILNTHRIELAIKQSILSERHIHAKVVCPSVVPQQKNRDFACIATIGTTKTPFVVNQIDNGGQVTYHAK